MEANKPWLVKALEGYRGTENWSHYAENFSTDLRENLALVMGELRRLGFYNLHYKDGKLRVRQLVNSRIVKAPSALDMCDQCERDCKRKVDGVFIRMTNGTVPKKCWE